MRSGCRGFESRSGHLIFSSICSVYIDRHIRVDLSDDEQYVRNVPYYIICQRRFRDFVTLEVSKTYLLVKVFRLEKRINAVKAQYREMEQ